MLLTAGHCAFDASVGRNASRIWFAPGARYQPGKAFNVDAMYGWWKSSGIWVSPAWHDSADGATDWALVNLSPEDGASPGTRVGYWPVITNFPWTPGVRTYLVGYPSTGTFGDPGYGAGAGQFACDSTYTGWTTLGAGSMIWSPCTMTPGASGGAWFAYYNQSWQIAGIIDRCMGTTANPTCSPFSAANGSPLLGASFLAFWNSVVAQITAQPA